MIENRFKEWKEGKLDDASMAASFFIYYHLKKYPNKKLERAFLQTRNASELLNQFVFKKVRSKALEALIKWCKGEWEFKLVSAILTPFEVLSWQAQGVRPVTIKIQHEFQPILHKEDCLEFFVHDLEHGYMFFHDDELKKMQLKFFSEIKETFKLDFWNKYLGDERFEYRLHYLISDMNTHLEHYKSYLYAMVETEDQKYFDHIFETSSVELHQF